MSISFGLSSILVDYLSGKRGLSDLRDWISLNMDTLLVPTVSPTTDQRVSSEVYHMMAEMDANGLAESQLREYLADVLEVSAWTG